MIAPPDPRLTARGGFVPAVRRSPNAPAYCSEAQALTYDVISRPNGTTLVKIRINDGEGEVACNPKLYEDRMASAYRMPTLLLPPGAEMGPDKCVEVRSHRSVTSDEAAVRSALPPEQLMEHFARQLADSGWTKELPPVGERVLSQRWKKQRPLPDGRRVSLTIVVPSDSLTGCRALSLGLELAGPR